MRQMIFPWTLVGYAGQRINLEDNKPITLLKNLNQKYFENGIYNKWNSQEAGWFIKLSHFLVKSKIN